MEYSNWRSFACDFVSMSEGPNAKTPITSRPPVNILDTYQSKKKKAALNMAERIIIFKHIWGWGLNWDGGAYLRGGLINLAKTLVSVSHKELKYKLSGKSPRTRNWRSCSWGSKTNPVFQLLNKPSQISPLEVLHIWLINTVNHSLVNTNKGEGGLKKEGEDLLNFFSCKGGTY